jgi:hypothetical protein
MSFAKSVFTIFCVNGIALGFSLSLLLSQCESSFSPTHTHVTWGLGFRVYDQAASMKPPHFPVFKSSLQDHTKEGLIILGKTNTNWNQC